MNAEVVTTAPAPLGPALGPFVVDIGGIAPAATFTCLEGALMALWQSLRVLPLGYEQASAFEHFLTGPDAAEIVVDMLRDPRRYGRVQLTFTMGGEGQCATIRSAGAAP